MFDINLIKTPGLQSVRDKKFEAVKESNKSENYQKSSNQSNKKTSNKYIIIFITMVCMFLVSSLVFFIYVNKTKYNTEYQNISIANVLTFIHSHESNMYLERIYTDDYKVTFITNNFSEDYTYINQALFDTLLNTQVLAFSDKNINKFYFNFNWYNQDSNSWNIDTLYNEINHLGHLDIQLELYNNQIILVSDINELINLFNFLKVSMVDHCFEYDIDLLAENLSNQKKYYKVIIRNYD